MRFGKNIFNLIGFNKKQFVKNSFWLGFGQFSSRIIKFLVIILIARNLNIDDYGKFSYLLALLATWVSLSGVFSNTSIYVKDIVSEGDYRDKFYSVLLFRIVLSVLILLIITLLTFFSGKFSDLHILLILFALAAIFDFMKDFFLARLHARLKMNIESGIVILQSLILFLLVFVNQKKLSLDLVAIGYLISSSISLFMAMLFDYVFSRMAKIASAGHLIDNNYLKKYIKISLQFGLLFAVIISAFPNFLIFLASYFTESYNLSGILNNYLSLISILTIYPMILMSASLPILSSFKSNIEVNKKMRQIGSLLLLTGIPLSLGGLMLGDRLIVFFFGREEMVLNYSFCIFLAIPVIYYIILFLQIIMLNNLVKKFISKYSLQIIIYLLIASSFFLINSSLAPFIFLFFYLAVFMIFMHFLSFKLKNIFDFKFAGIVIFMSLLMSFFLFLLSILGLSVLSCLLLSFVFYFLFIFLFRSKILPELLNN